MKELDREWEIGDRNVEGSAECPVSAPVRFAQLAKPRQVLIRLCQAINYGYVEGLDVKDCDPVFDEPPLVLVDVKLDSDDTPRPEVGLIDFELRHEFCRLLTRLDEFKNGKIERIEVRAGLPRRVLFRLAGALRTDCRLSQSDPIA